MTPSNSSWWSDRTLWWLWFSTRVLQLSWFSIISIFLRATYSLVSWTLKREWRICLDPLRFHEKNLSTRFQFELNCTRIQMLRLIFRQIASNSHCNVPFDEKDKPKYCSNLIVLNGAHLLLIIHDVIFVQITNWTNFLPNPMILITVIFSTKYSLSLHTFTCFFPD